MHFQCPRIKLTQLQSRFAASLGASLMLLAIYFVLSSPRLAYAQETSPGLQADVGQSTAQQDHNWFRIESEASEDTLWIDEGSEAASLGFEGEPVKSDKTRNEIPSMASKAEKRQSTPSAQALMGNNRPGAGSINASQSQQWVFSRQMVLGPSGVQGAGLPGNWTEFPEQDSASRQSNLMSLGSDEERRDVKRQTSSSDVLVYVSINVCTQPVWRDTATMRPGPAPQLTLYISSTLSNPGPGADAAQQTVVRLQQGYAAASLFAAGNVRIAVAAPPIPTGFSGGWNYTVAASIDNFYHVADFGLPPLYLVDTDTSGALLVTENLTQALPDDDEYKAWMALDASPPFALFLQSEQMQNITDGLMASYCGLSNAAGLLQSSEAQAANPDAPVQMSMVTRGIGDKPKQQFHLRGLNATASYQGMLAMNGNSTASGPGVIGGGGRVWAAANFTTKSDGNCALLYDLPFCSSIAHAVPSNPFLFPNTTSLANFYDTYAQSLYTNFTLSLQLVACNTTAVAQYSPAQNCDTCAAAYKSWLCAVTIPRCDDFSRQDASWLQKRNMAQAFLAIPSATAGAGQSNENANGSENATMFLPQSVLNENYIPMSGAPREAQGMLDITYGTSSATNSSRLPRIDETIQPGPYNELLPCIDLCEDLVRSCPASFGFGCPAPGRGREVAYGTRDGAGPGAVGCSFPGAVYVISAAGRQWSDMGRVLGMFVVVLLVVGVM